MCSYQILRKSLCSEQNKDLFVLKKWIPAKSKARSIVSSSSSEIPISSDFSSNWWTYFTVVFDFGTFLIGEASSSLETLTVLLVSFGSKVLCERFKSIGISLKSLNMKQFPVFSSHIWKFLSLDIFHYGSPNCEIWHPQTGTLYL